MYLEHALIITFFVLLLEELHVIVTSLEHRIWSNLSLFGSRGHQYLEPEETIVYSPGGESMFVYVCFTLLLVISTHKILIKIGPQFLYCWSNDFLGCWERLNMIGKQEAEATTQLCYGSISGDHSTLPW